MRTEPRKTRNTRKKEVLFRVIRVFRGFLFRFCHWSFYLFGFVSDFGFRISDFFMRLAAGHIAPLQGGDLLDELIDRALQGLELVPHLRQLGDHRQAQLLLALRRGGDADVGACRWALPVYFVRLRLVTPGVRHRRRRLRYHARSDRAACS